MNKSTTTYGFIGCGNMGASLIGGLINNGCQPENIIGCDANEETLEHLKTTLGIQIDSDPLSLISKANVIVLSVKPQIMESVLKPLADSLSDQKPLFISIAAGIPLSAMQNWLGGAQAIVRVMPNTPSLLGAGVSGLCSNEHATEEQKQLADDMMSSVGSNIWLEEESQIDAVTAVSGSGPAYFFRVMEVMEQVAIELGLSQEQAATLVHETAYGAALMVKESGDSPTTLREKVTSPAGTTERALNIMNENGIETLFSKALEGARDRSIELGKQFGNEEE